MGELGVSPRTLVSLSGPLRDVVPNDAARNAAPIAAGGEPLTFRVALGDVARDAILISEMASVARGNRDLPRAFVLPLLARTSCVVQLNGRQLVLEYGIYRLRG